MAGSDVDLAGDGLVDDGLFLFLEEGDQFLFGLDVALDAAVGVVEEVGDGGLFGEGGNCCKPLVGIFAVKGQVSPSPLLLHRVAAT